MANTTQEFDALLNLLRLRSATLEPNINHAADSLSEVAVEDDASVIATELNANIDLDTLKQRFLDRLAEMFSSSKGGYFVRSTVLREDQSTFEVFTSSNRGFDQKDSDHFEACEQDLRHLAAYSRTRVDEDLAKSPAALSLWHNMVCYQSERVKHYVADFVDQIACLDAEGGDGWKRDESSQPRESLAALKQLCLQHGSSISSDAEAAGIIINRAYELRQREDVVLFLRDSTSTGSFVKLRDSLSRLSRLRLAFHTCLLAARMFDSLCYFTITKIDLDPMPMNLSLPHTLTFNQAVGLLGNSSASYLRPLLRRKTKDKLEKRYNSLRRETRSLHAEMQMLVYLVKEDLMASVFPYIGASKYCCVMCWNYLQSWKPLDTRGCHGHVHHRWLEPSSVSEPPRNYLARFDVAATATREWMMTTLTSQFHHGVVVPESSVGTMNFVGEALGKSAPPGAPSGSQTEHQIPCVAEGLCVSRQNIWVEDGMLPLPALAHNDLRDQNRTCHICTHKNAKRCAECMSATYCSFKCQKDDRRLHQELCRQYQVVSKQKPQGRHFLGILFPEQVSSPRLVWLPASREYEADEPPFDLIKVKEFLGDDNPTVSDAYVPRSMRRDHLLDYALVVSFRDCFLFDGSSSNKAINCCTNKGSTGHYSRGPVVVYRIDIYYLNCKDVTLDDLTHAVDFFHWYRNDEAYVFDASRAARLDIKTVRGVKITCEGDQVCFGLEPFEPVAVAPSHLIFDRADSVPGIPERIGVPLVCNKSEPDRAWTDLDDRAEIFDNQTAVFLHTNDDPKSSGWGWAKGSQWLSDVGSVIVFRRDKKDITPCQVEAVCNFCRDMTPFFEDSLGGGHVDRTKEEVLSYLRPAYFKKWFDRYGTHIIAEGETLWKSEVCPAADGKT